MYIYIIYVVLLCRILIIIVRLLALPFGGTKHYSYFGGKLALSVNIGGIFLLLFGCIFGLQGQSLQRCASEPNVRNSSAVMPLSFPRDQIEIPIVFHIIWNQEEHNIPDEYIYSELEVLNEDYNMLNEDIIDVPAEFKKHIGNPNISFCLANRDPADKPSNGIIRKKTRWVNIAGQRQIVDGRRRIKSDELGGSDPWNTKRYLNVWIGDRTDGLLGDATFPTEEDANKIDGIVISHIAVGRRLDVDSPFNKGRTLTHEIAHYLNLYHLSGSESGCFTDGDFVEDTPTQFEEYFGTCENPVVSCDSRDMDTNFLSLRDDACLTFFTKGQVTRMTESLFTHRFELISSNTCSQSNPLPPDPLKIAEVFTMQDHIEISLPTLANRDYSIDVLDVMGRYQTTIYNNPGHIYRLNYRDYPSGIYIVLLHVAGKRYSRKIYID